ncbi:aminotransferase class V-fold PLP-dependent enzyme [Candidatus Laterigemmans baculatus]|uniref:aminotransferase class V-fold PLP-dependent enzyme n=1 Tax=Candidatus Laterigemmans baculatus TaxID=2770505 RepID=UPI001F192D87|nr:aminotransferase class V-fold PLP-dependent enzyme [Candidatus Laterigemmans baculatus]
MDSSLNKPARIYLDHAATGWPKSEAVYRAVETELREHGAAAGRGAYGEALHSNAVVEEVRRLAARLVSSSATAAHAAVAGESVVLTANGTASLNLAIHGLLRPGDHVVTTAAEHNSVLRPLEWWRSRQGVVVETVPCDASGRVRSEDVLARVNGRTRLVAVVHASNVTGAVQPVEEIAAGLRRGPAAEAMLLCDAAQTAGSLPIGLSELGVDLLAMPGHKGLGGPLGTGLLCLGPRAAEQIEPLMQGGTGSQSDRLEMPTKLPERLESGNLNVPALAGLAAGLRETLERDLEATARQQRDRTVELASRLAELPGIRVISGGELPILSLVLSEFDCREAAAVLDTAFGIEVRAGLHCAPLIHRYLDTAPSGTLRISFAPTTPQSELDQLAEALEEVAAQC